MFCSWHKGHRIWAGDTDSEPANTTVLEGLRNAVMEPPEHQQTERLGVGCWFFIFDVIYLLPCKYK